MYSHPQLVSRHIAALNKRRDNRVIAACAFTLAANGEAQLFPHGRFKATDGRPFEIPAGWFIDADIAERVIERATQRKNRILVDYEHQTLYAEFNGQPSPAAGWIDPATLEYREETGMFAKVAWTRKAKQMIEDGEYLYLSPVFEYDPYTGEVIEILHLAITNDPAVDGMAENMAAATRKKLLSPTNPQTEETIVDLKKLIELLGLPEDSTEEQAQAALKKLQGAGEAYTALKKTLGVSDDADTETIKTAVTALKAKTFDPSQHVPLESFEALKKEVANLRSGNAQGEVADLVKQGMDDGKLLPSQEPWAMDLGNKDVAALKQYIETTPAIAALGSQQSKGKETDLDDKDITLSDTERAVCKQFGLSESDYIATLKADREPGVA